MIWDFGIYENRSEFKNKIIDIAEAYSKGHIKINLEGLRAKGYWTLIRTFYQEKKNQWLIIKEKDNFSNSGEDLVKKYLTSAKTGRTMEEIAKLRNSPSNI